MGQRPNWYQIGNKTCYIPQVSKFYEEQGYIYILTVLKVSSTASRCVFYRPKHDAKGAMELNFEGRKCEK